MLLGAINEEKIGFLKFYSKDFCHFITNHELINWIFMDGSYIIHIKFSRFMNIDILKTNSGFKTTAKLYYVQKNVVVDCYIK